MKTITTNWICDLCGAHEDKTILPYGWEQVDVSCAFEYNVNIKHLCYLCASKVADAVRNKKRDESI
jgi:hypothetical protein